MSDVKVKWIQIGIQTGLQLLMIGGGLLGWYKVHELNLVRDREYKKREIRVEYLLEAYRKLERNMDRPGRHRDSRGTREFESAIGDIQFLGTVKQIELVVDYLHRKEQGEEDAPLNRLMKDLRTDLRNELGLEKVTEDLKFVTMGEGEKPGK